MSVQTMERPITIQRIERAAADIKAGKHEQLKPGMPFRFHTGMRVFDRVPQGDLYIMLWDGSIPEGYVKVAKPTEKDKQLVPGNTQGSKHCLDSLKGVTLYRPAQWDGEDLQGPMVVCKEETTILHPTHGPVTVLAGMSVLCGYQPNYDYELRRERRNAD